MSGIQACMGTAGECSASQACLDGACRTALPELPPLDLQTYSVEAEKPDTVSQLLATQTPENTGT